MKLLGVDYGTRRLGLAWADTTLGAVLPYGVIEAETLPRKIKEIVRLVAEERIAQIVVGFPVGLNGKENLNTERVKKFVFELQKAAGIPVECFDERFSSQAADRLGGGVSRDEKAAMIILQGYLERKK